MLALLLPKVISENYEVKKWLKKVDLKTTVHTPQLAAIGSFTFALSKQD
jgi:hypothetical protein